MPRTSRNLSNVGRDILHENFRGEDVGRIRILEITVEETLTKIKICVSTLILLIGLIMHINKD